MSNDLVKEKEEEIKLNFYTVSVMLSALIAAAATVVSFIFTAKPANDTTDFWFGKDVSYIIIDQMEPDIFPGSKADKYLVMAYVVAGLCLIGTVSAIIATLRVSDKTKKPALICGLITFATAIAAVIVCVSARSYAEDLCTTYLGNNQEVLDIMGIKKGSNYNIYTYCFVAVIVNCVVQAVGLLGLFAGKIKWNKDGKTY